MVGVGSSGGHEKAARRLFYAAELKGITIYLGRAFSQSPKAKRDPQNRLTLDGEAYSIIILVF
jgi:hypothetical protein